ncbi:Dihydrofolate reductase [Dyadobacter koreensis]|uniref:Dihydrofolate reductase n=1 Tax=Dyadobacter koreensis TaxID=408657 RepID=A0A1H6QAT7_9BACT|nr:dihydrofolate reductase family protein [Dyadobacter koreensis]SEI40853.1 Dihydrofolate reductase [Dyadobacter koreensis]
MRTVTFGMNISIDGYCDHTAFSPDQEVHDYFTQMMDEVDLIFFGRVMYELMFPYWADVAKNKSGTADEIRFAQKLTAIERVVVSRSLHSTDDKTRIVRSDPSKELLRLKQQPGKKISVDSLSMLAELIEADLIDEFNLVVHPVMIGKGRRLLDVANLNQNLNLKLNDTILFKSGSVALHYLKR